MRLGLPHVWHLRELVGRGKPFRLPYEGPALGKYLQRPLLRYRSPTSEVRASLVYAIGYRPGLLA